ncbi:MAG: cytochrome c peroxidase [Bacteroidota bacterium]|nr:cytochrome c peroxidase [Bacteroidota bacterium]
MKNSLICVCLSLLLFSCKKAEKIVPAEETVTHDITPYVIDYGRFPMSNLATDNPLTEQGVLLGRMLFYDTKLSGNNTQSCGSCHLQAFAFNDTATLSVGIKGLKGKRNAMSVFNTLWHNSGFFWDGRASLLRHQALMPIQDELEMDETLENVVAKITAEKNYKDQFIRAFGSNEITAEKIGLALEQFMNSIVSNQSKYDLFLDGKATLTESEERGRKLYFLEFNAGVPSQSGADCAHCHGGFNFENDRYMNNGLDQNPIDKGREDVTGMAADRGKFKVPSLRNIALTAPYMHDGRFKTLEEVLEHYNNGIKSSPSLDPALQQTIATGLSLTEQNKADIIAFLKTLTDQNLISNKAFSNPF